MAWKSILIITAAIVSIYGCAKFKINLFLSIIITIIFPIFIVILSNLIDMIKFNITLMRNHKKSNKIEKQLERKLNDHDYTYKCGISGDNTLYIEMKKRNALDEDYIIIYTKKQKINDLVNELTSIKEDILNVKNKKIYDILKSLNQDIIKTATLQLFYDVCTINNISGENIEYNIDEISILIDNRLDNLKSIKKEELPNNNETLSSYYVIHEIVDQIDDITFLDMIYTENTFAKEAFSEAVNIISVYIFNKIYDINNDKIK